MVVRLQEPDQLSVSLPQVVQLLLLLPQVALGVGHDRPLLGSDDFLHLRVSPRDGGGQLCEYPLALHKSSLRGQLQTDNTGC